MPLVNAGKGWASPWRRAGNAIAFSLMAWLCWLFGFNCCSVWGHVAVPRDLGGDDWARQRQGIRGFGSKGELVHEGSCRDNS